MCFKNFARRNKIVKVGNDSLKKENLIRNCTLFLILEKQELDRNWVAKECSIIVTTKRAFGRKCEHDRGSLAHEENLFQVKPSCKAKNSNEKKKIIK